MKGQIFDGDFYPVFVHWFRLPGLRILLAAPNVVEYGHIGLEFFYANCSRPLAVAFDGVHIWAACGNGVLAKGLAATVVGIGTGVYIVNNGRPVGPAPAGLASDGANIWVANSGDGTVTRY